MRFDDLLSTVYRRNAAVSSSTQRISNRGEEPFCRDVYDFFGLAGATFVVADSLHRRFIMLQDGVPEAAAYSSAVRFPIDDLPVESSSFCSEFKEVAKYSRFCNRIFQIQRSQEGLGGYGARGVVLARQPEFLARLAPHARDAAEGWHDWHATGYIELLHGIAAWRLLLWLLELHGPSAALGAVVKLVEPRRLARPRVRQYFDGEFRARVPAVLDDAYPEASITRLDQIASWSRTFSGAYGKWRILRTSLDGWREGESRLAKDLVALRSLYQPHMVNAEIRNLLAVRPAEFSTIVAEWLLRRCGPDVARLPLGAVLLQLHDAVGAPLPAYYYYSLLDGRPKEHFIVAVMRSERYPLRYHLATDKKLQQHTAVVIGLASLHVGPPRENQVVRRGRLKTCLRICADRIVDDVFIDGLIRLERASTNEMTERILHLARTRLRRAFVLGSFDSVVSFFSQQSRALMLVKSLVAGGSFLKREDRVAVIGGGAAGVTAAAALANCDYGVDIIERGDDVLQLQKSGVHRFIFPRIAEWPQGHCLDEAAGLPLLTWNASSADKVLTQIRQGYDRICKMAGNRLNLLAGRRVSSIRDEEDGIVITTDNDPMGRKYCAVIAAIGYGLDNKNGGPSYWEPDTLSEQHDVRRRVLIAGTGDGGLTDAIRAKLSSRPSGAGHPHEHLLRRLASHPGLQEFGWRAKEHVDGPAMALLLAGLGDEVRLQYGYAEIFERLPGKTKKDIEEFFRSTSAHNVEVVLLANSRYFLRLESALLNRLVVFLLIQFRLITLQVGRLRKPRTLPDGRVVATILRNGVSEKQEYDVVIPRVGPPRDFFSTNLPWLVAKNEIEARRVAAALRLSGSIDTATFDYFRTR